MVTLRLTGHINRNGELRVDLPPGVPPGEVDVIITMTSAPASDATWTDDEISRVIRVTPRSGEEIAAMLDEAEDGYHHIADSARWVDEQRNKRREDRQW